MREKFIVIASLLLTVLLLYKDLPGIGDQLLACWQLMMFSLIVGLEVWVTMESHRLNMRHQAPLYRPATRLFTEAKLVLWPAVLTAGWFIKDPDYAVTVTTLGLTVLAVVAAGCVGEYVCSPPRHRP